ncbi:hypothetical protein EW145_g3944 [Phellinidium pouzarii]|uniref:Uncharacterized protein n=1 Tax=Phellinidium pouzarii TaxID=167371 RepID=A0A4S4L5T3_9AGAM|nr:hypothetical protein EW145_g3944 [Phellinidium pouzarii]
MPAPVVYFFLALGTIATAYAIKEFVFDPWLEERRARRGGRRGSRSGRRSVAPHFVHEEGRDMPDRSPSPSMSAHGSDNGTMVELESLGPSSVRSPAMGSGLRNRRTRSSAEGGSGSAQSGIIDGSIVDIPYRPMQPESWRGSAATATPTVSPPQSPFTLGSESVTPLTSPHSTPLQLHNSSIISSPMHSPIVVSPHELPSLFEDAPLPPRPSSPSPFQASEDLNAVQSPAVTMPSVAPSTYFENPWAIPPASARPQAPENLHVLVQSTSMQTSSSSLSFNTALSPQTEFRSLPPSQLTSPFSDSLTLSENDTMYSFGSRSSESFLTFNENEGGRLDSSVSNSEVGDDDELNENLSEGPSEGEGSWEEVSEPRSGPMSPRL